MRQDTSVRKDAGAGSRRKTNLTSEMSDWGGGGRAEWEQRKGLDEVENSVID